MRDRASREDTLRQHRLLIWITLVVLLSGLLLRAVFPESDPYYAIWTSYITDEGRWTEQARNILLFGHLDIDNWLSLIHLVLSPLFQALTAISFSLFGVNFTSARLVSMLCGGVILLASFLFLRRRFTADALFLAILALALQPDLVFFSRVAIPEIPAMLFELLAFITLVSQPRSVGKAALAGLLTMVALGMKATVAPVVVIFTVIILCARRTHGSAPHWKRVSAYLGVMIAPVVVIVIAALLLADGAFIDRFLGSLLGLESFIQRASIYKMLSLLFYGKSAPSLNLLLVGAWVMAGLLIAKGRLPETKATTIYIGSAIWIAGWLAVSASLTYFPPRYVFHALIPLILHLGAGLTLLQSLGWRAVLESLSRLDGRRRVVVYLWLSLPAAAVLCPAVIAIADLAGLSIDRLREHLPLLLVLTASLAVLFLRIRRSDVTGFGLAAFSLIVALLWFAGVRSGLIDDVFWNAGADHLLAWVLLLAVSGVMTIYIVRLQARAGMIRLLGYIYLVAIGSIWLSQNLSGLVNPSYTIAEASADLAQFSEDDSGFYSGAAASLFINNRLRYMKYMGIEDDFDVQRLPEILVIVFDRVNHKMLEHYDLIHERDLRLARKPSPEPVLKIYRLK